MINIKFKKIIGIFLSAILVFSLVGCNEGAKGGQINLMTWGGDFIPREIINEFEKETGIKLIIRKLPLMRICNLYLKLI